MRWYLLIHWFLVPFLSAWNLATYDDTGLKISTEHSDYELVHVSVFYVRSFLTIRNRHNTSNG